MTSETELRDRLAVDRTVLANERTLLSYVRTAVALAAGGAGLQHLVLTPTASFWGAVMMAVGVSLVPFGLWQFLRMRRRLSRALAARP